MKVLKAKPYADREIFKSLNSHVADWFRRRFGGFTESQRYSIIPIKNKKNILVSSPTGSGKTLCAFASVIDHLVSLSEKGELENKTYAVYISPLKALARDIEVNLRQPLKEIEEIAGKKFGIRIGLRTGDTTQSERAKMAKNAPHILITTPESFAIVLTSKKFVEHLEGVEFCIVDEIHAMGNKRGVDLSLSLERLNYIAEKWPVKIGLSATVEPLEEVAKFLVGIDKNDKNREVIAARVPFTKKLDIQVLTPVEDLIEHENPRIEMYHLIHDLVSKHKTTLIFTNTRSATERVVNYLKDKFPVEYGDENIAAHHSSLSRQHRFEIEERLRQGKLKVVVCSTSLELGIDIGYIDLVILLGSPKASSRALQRIGRAGHKLHETAKGRFIVLDMDDLVECSVIQKEMLEGKIDKIEFPKNCLDVLAQQIYGMCIYQTWRIDELLSLIRKSYCYSDITKEDFLSVISYLSGQYELEKNRVYAKIWYDPSEGRVGKRGKLARAIYMTNVGTIPEESFVTVKLSSGEKIGVIDEGFLERMKKGDIFVLGGNKYSYQYTRGMNLYVKPEVKKAPTIPSWFSETLPLAFDSAIEIGNFRKLMREMLEAGKDSKKVISFIMKYLYVEEKVAEEIYRYFLKQHNFSEIPHSELITIEKYIDDRDNKKYILVNSMYGRRVNDALSRAYAYLLGSYKNKRDVEIGVSDTGFYLASENFDIEKILYKLNKDNIESILKEAIEKTDILVRRFRHCATRSLMILRSYKGERKSVKKQQMKSHFLIAGVKKISNEFPILKEAKREVLEDLMDIKNAKKVLSWVETGKLKVSIDYAKIPSPFSLNLLLQGHLDLMRIEDKQDFLKRMWRLYQEEIDKKGKLTDYNIYDSAYEEDMRELEEYLGRR